MAWNFSKFNFFSRLDARGRIFFLVAAVALVLFLVYLGSRFLAGGGGTTGPSKVATAPNIQSVPGSQLTPEYYRSVVQANQQAAQQAQISAGSAVPTLLNPGQQAGGGCTICSDESANVKNLLDGWARQGTASQDVAAQLEQLANKNVSPLTYAQQLQQLVKEGKLTPEQARQLLAEYNKQHQAAFQNQSARGMDGLIQSGALPIAVANQLLGYQKANMSPCDYTKQLQNLVQQGKISSTTAQTLQNQYTQQKSAQLTQEGIAKLQLMIGTGELTPDVEKDLENLENQNVSFDTFASALQTYVSQGKMVPNVAAKILNDFQQQKSSMCISATMNDLIQQAVAAAFQEVVDLLKEGKITQETATALNNLIQSGVSPADFQSSINQMVQAGKLTPEIGQLKIADYAKIKNLQDMQQRLAALQGKTPQDYADELKNDVQAGLITPEQAAQLMKEYLANQATPTTQITPVTNDQAFAQLQQRAAAGAPAQPTGTVSPADFAAAQSQVEEQEEQARNQRIANLMSGMQAQAGQLINAWQTPVMQHYGNSAVTVSTTTAKTTTTTGAGAATTTTTTTTGATGAPLIKAGTVLFAVLDTAVNSDYKTSPVMATIVQGPFKGAKLLGQLVVTQSVAGQMDRVALNFNLMNMDQWSDSKSITAYAIDPDTARAVFASNVNYHYFLRFGSIMASSFLQGFANAISNSGATTTTGIFGTSTQHIETSTSQNIWIGLGQVGTTLGNAIQNYVNIPPTVRVDPGVGLGILFMADVTGAAMAESTIAPPTTVAVPTTMAAPTTIAAISP